nr:hypothetical protein [Tanacetum cinerariifolium]
APGPLLCAYGRAGGFFPLRAAPALPRRATSAHKGNKSAGAAVAARRRLATESGRDSRELSGGRNRLGRKSAGHHYQRAVCPDAYF